MKELAEDKVFRGAILQLEDFTDPLRSDVTLLAAALITLGFGKAGPKLFHVTYEHVRGETRFHSVWTFRAVSRDRKHDGVKLRAAWDDPEWLGANPLHPLTVIRDGLSYAKALSHSPKFTLAELNTLERPDAYLEASMFNLIQILKAIPRSSPKGIIRVGPDGYAGYVPRVWSEPKKRDFMRYVERRDLRGKLEVPV